MDSLFSLLQLITTDGHSHWFPIFSIVRYEISISLHFYHPVWLDYFQSISTDGFVVPTFLTVDRKSKQKKPDRVYNINKDVELAGDRRFNRVIS